MCKGTALHYLGVIRTVHQCFKSFMTKRSFSVHVEKNSLALLAIGCGVPQVFVVGPCFQNYICVYDLFVILNSVFTSSTLIYKSFYH